MFATDCGAANGKRAETCWTGARDRFEGFGLSFGERGHRVVCAAIRSTTFCLNLCVEQRTTILVSSFSACCVGRHAEHAYSYRQRSRLKLDSQSTRRRLRGRVRKLRPVPSTCLMLPRETIVCVYRGPKSPSLPQHKTLAPLSASCPAVARHTKIENTVRDIDIEVAMPSPFAVQIASNRLGRECSARRGHLDGSVMLLFRSLSRDKQTLRG